MAIDFIKRALKIFQLSTPILIVLFMAAVIVFMNSYPTVPEIANETNDYRNRVKYQQVVTETDQKESTTIKPNSPSLPNTITPVVSPEKVEEIVKPSPDKPEPITDENGTVIDTSPKNTEPSLEIKLFTGLINVAPLILVAALGGFGIYLLFKYKKHFTLKSLFGIAIGLVTVATIAFIGYLTLGFIDFLYNLDFNYDQITWVIIPISILLGSWISINIVSKKTTPYRRNLGLSVAGGFMGAFLASFLPFWIIFILPIAITIFDIYSVRSGPIKKIMALEEAEKRKKTVKMKFERQIDNDTTKNKREIDGDTTKDTISEDTKSEPIKMHSKQKTNLKITKQKTKVFKKKGSKDDFDLILMYDNPNWSLGLGDFVIYSMFTSAVLTYFLLYLPYYVFYTPELGLILPWGFFIVCVIGIIIGFKITLKLLEKHDYLPGLPLSIGVSFTFFVICLLILQAVNYILYAEFAIII